MVSVESQQPDAPERKHYLYSLRLGQARVVVQVGAFGFLALLLLEQRGDARGRNGCLGRHGSPVARQKEREGRRTTVARLARGETHDKQLDLGHSTQPADQCL